MLNTEKKLRSLFHEFIEAFEIFGIHKGDSVMKKSKIINSVKDMAIGSSLLTLISCGNFGTIIKMPAVKEVPGAKYERIIKLNNPFAASDQKFAGLVFVKKGASVCTDYPREEIIKSLDELTAMEKNSFLYFSNYAIAAGGRIFGFVSLPIGYNAILWEDEKNESCKYKVQIIPLDRENNDTGEELPKAGPGGGHGGGHGH
jgi:hypothetical protein